MQQDSRLLDDVGGNNTEGVSLLSANKPLFQYKCIRIANKKVMVLAQSPKFVGFVCIDWKRCSSGCIVSHIDNWSIVFHIS